MRRVLISCAAAIVTLFLAPHATRAVGPVNVPAPAHRQAVHIGHVGPYCVYYVGKPGQASPYRYYYNSDRYPRYYGGTHARVLQNVGRSPADIGLRDTAW